MAQIVFKHCTVISVRDYVNAETKAESQFVKISDTDFGGGEFSITCKEVDASKIPLSWPLAVKMDVKGSLFNNRQVIEAFTFEFEPLVPILKK